ncbi:indolethylamine N-methyltransferase-like [Ixodes scapularis]|uniref:indolethylamine N-methyltransferase-like n=1 Tax=Ixodes scapularis TaxID=6945 RepID=UPI001A9DE414|nr:indolethylamine N-methyltransferase-like [Ixodes scapularis]
MQVKLSMTSSSHSSESMSSQELKNSHKEQFVGRTYVDRYVAGKFSSSQAEKLHRFFHSDLIQGETLLDAGSGPVILNALMTSGRFKLIELSDLVEDNRLELKKWMNRDEDAIDWSLFAEKIAAVEGYSDIKKGAIEILERTRAAIHNVVPCGVLERGVLPVEHRENFDVVISSGCLESAAVDVESYRRVVCNVVTLAKPGGLLVIFGVGGLNEYQVGSADFTVMNLTENVLKEAMTDAGLQIELYRPHKIGSFLGSSDVFIFNMVVRKA